MASQGSLVIIGASVRAAAFSALRAGYQPWCCDLFGDRDLHLRVNARQIPPRHYPKKFVQLVENALDGSWMFTGGLENHPELVQRIHQTRELWGVSASQIRQLRNPDLLAHIYSHHGILHPRVQTQPPPDNECWLQKPYRSVAGQRIQEWKSQRHINNEVYYQEYINGTSTSAVYVGNGTTAELLGVTRQLIGESWLNATGFLYCGNIGVVDLNEKRTEAYRRIGNVLVTEFGLRGLFGIDCILQGDTPYPVEVNPRYTASVEVIEYSLGLTALTMHRHGCVENRDLSFPQNSTRLVAGKAIYYAPETFVFPEVGPWTRELNPQRNLFEMPEFADIPDAGHTIEARHPVFTFFTAGTCVSEVYQLLQKKAETIPGLLGIG
ncbi:MAG: ATP-grasp domain-containing protein [Gemmataceae bacterium]